MPARQATLFDAKGPTIRTGNEGLADSLILSEGYGSKPVVFVLDTNMPDHRWRLFVDGAPIGPTHDIGERVGVEIRRALAKANKTP